MKTRKVAVDFGERQTDIEVPKNAVIAEFKEPPRLRAPVAAIRAALAKPHGSPPFADLIEPGMRVAIGFDDPTRPPAPWQAIMPVVVDELLKHGVREEDITLISANGHHCKWSPAELAAFLGAETFNRFWPRGQIINHDCADADGLKFLGVTENGGVAEHNRRFVEADLMVYCGHVGANNWGGYTGTGVVVGLGSTRSIESHHCHQVVDHPDSTSGDHLTMYYRRVKVEVNAQIEAATGKRIFYVNWVGGADGRMAGVFAGHSPEVEPPAWKLADTFHRMKVPQADVMVIGLPGAFAYGSVHNQLIAAIGLTTPPRIWLNRPVLREGGVIIGVSPSAGRIDAERFPAYKEVIDLYARYHDIAALREHEGVVNNRPEYLHQYTHGYGYHPAHVFWLFYESDYVMRRASAVIMAGTTNPGAFRALGIRPARDFAQAWEYATTCVGKDPVTVVAPTFWSRRPFKFEVH